MPSTLQTAENVIMRLNLFKITEHDPHGVFIAGLQLWTVLADCTS